MVLRYMMGVIRLQKEAYMLMFLLMMFMMVSLFTCLCIHMKSTSQPMAEATEIHINRPVIESFSKANDVDSYSQYRLKKRAHHLHGHSHDDHHSRHDLHSYHHHSPPK